MIKKLNGGKDLLAKALRRAFQDAAEKATKPLSDRMDKLKDGLGEVRREQSATQQDIRDLGPDSRVRYSH